MSNTKTTDVITTLWIDSDAGDTWERNESTMQIRVVRFADGTIMSKPARWELDCCWTFESAQKDLDLTFSPLPVPRCEGCAESQFGLTHKDTCPEYAVRAAGELMAEERLGIAQKTDVTFVDPDRRNADVEQAHAEAREIDRMVFGHKITIVTGGELHAWPDDVPPADITLNLTRLLRDPNHVLPEALRDGRGDEDDTVYKFVMSTRGASDLVVNSALVALDLATHGPVTIYVVCRGGKHRGPGIGKALRTTLSVQWGAYAFVRNLHAHLDRVVRA